MNGTESTVACRLRVYRDTQAASPYLKRLLNDAELAISSLAEEADSLLQAIGLDPDTYRTECGYLNIPKIIGAIKTPGSYPSSSVEDRLSIALSAIHDLRQERDDLIDGLAAVTQELDEASPMMRCDCCGSSFRLHKMVIEEGGRWECYPCWEALNERERSK